MTVLKVDDLHVSYPASGSSASGSKVVRAVNGVSFSLAAGETLGIVGESGCGKSTTARAVLGLVPMTSGTVRVCGDPLDLGDKPLLRRLRSSAQMIFQDPFSTLDPRMRIGQAIAEPLRLHKMVSSKTEMSSRTEELLEMVGLPVEAVDKYPHEFSGGQLQRVGIARALAVEPQLIVADEPVSALDVSIQAQVLNLMRSLQEKTGVAYLFIGHDLAVVKHVSRRIAVMYLGRVVEMSSAEDLFADPRHPYTSALLSAVPLPDPVKERERERIILKGDPPSPHEVLVGCAFQSRCPYRRPGACDEESPPLREVSPGHSVACHYAEELHQIVRAPAAGLQSPVQSQMI